MIDVVEVVAFEPAHRAEIREAPEAIGCDASPAVWARVAEQGGSVTLRVDGRTVMCGGVVEYEPGLFEAWAAVDAVDGRRHAKHIHRTAKQVLERAAQACGRVRALVVVDFAAGHRWVKRLGFQYDSHLFGARPDGRACAVYFLGAA